MMISSFFKCLGVVAITLMLLLIGPIFVVSSDEIDLSTPWGKANHDRSGLAPDPATTPQAIVQVYGARTFSWRGAFAVHTWIAVKPENAKNYTRLEVIGWRKRRGLPVTAATVGWPDRNWFGSRPELYYELHGSAAENMIPAILEAARQYPYPDEYEAWPGPNSNTFTAFVLRRIPEMTVDLPPTAIGKDYLDSSNHFVAMAPSNTGIQVSFFGLIGAIASKAEGLEINLLGLGFGLDPDNLALRLPGIGKVGFIKDTIPLPENINRPES
ncbi:DUF3750 domain-containing protein [Kiloniella laminariae]|uniref:DUF3750 domain-containing protein n=1 Tax=Kiloniella laminariae TaxID=454162 RepID=A0ABT4LDZ2_9PROT|nr:DUF3750 domain-containing protein [Kiloniella laminariae]MCZ4279310.1 DUF3750 domain-containing protein [Kiloniella laminariae]